MVWYFIGVYIINRTLHSHLEMQNFSSCVQKYIFQHSKRNFKSLCGHVICSRYLSLTDLYNRPKAEVSKLRSQGTIGAQPRRIIHPYALISGHPEWWTLGSPNTFAQQQSQIPPPKNNNSSQKSYPPPPPKGNSCFT